MSRCPGCRCERGLIIHLPAGKAHCTLHWVDIAAGWEAFERSMWARDWKARKDLHEPYTPRHPEAATTPPARRGRPGVGRRGRSDAQGLRPPVA